jgi:hypothetical protein
VVPAGAAAPALNCSAAKFCRTPELPALVPNEPKPVNGLAGDPVELVDVGTDTFDAYAVPVAVPVAIEYAVWLVPKTVNDAVFAEEAAGLNCHILTFDTVKATVFVK